MLPYRPSLRCTGFTRSFHRSAFSQSPRASPSVMSFKRKDPPTASLNDAKKPKKNADLTSFFGPPKVTPAGGGKPVSLANGAAAAMTEPPASKFDKEKWVAGLTAEQKKLLKLEIDTLDPSWLAVLKEEIVSPGFLDLKRFLQKEIDSKQKIYPPMEDVYSWSRHCPLHKVRAVILGQDPYHGPNQAMGLCFAVRPPTKAPPSLKNIYMAIKKDYPTFKAPPDNGGLLTPWADQGVLLLNTCLTVRASQANSHANHGWEKFTQKIIDVVVKLRTRGVVFLAWGSPAQKRCEKISGARHLVLKSVHPSPLSAHKGFFDCGHFKKTNEWLESRYGEEGIINWDLNVQNPIKAPATQKPAKITATQDEGPGEAETDTRPVEKRAGDEAKGEEEFDDDDDDDDEDAIAAIEELAQAEAEAEKNGGA